ncbi:MAG: nitroreductase family protein [Corynebacterium sp.]|uniref:nitroreductase family protein n=1 Tax=Corynebacterium sp. TaxID=1720 RepID=UPI0026DD32C6|nr:nitroreductase family protein [Corynebacterium sp.]MDO4761975.1 nitroreductase family protein [Corynebacterium sp.]
MSMTVSEAITSRRATRIYADTPVSEETALRVAQLALEAPTAFNAQRADLVVVRDQAVKDGLFAASGQAQLRNAPVVFVAVARTGVPTDLEEIFGAERAAGIAQWIGTDPARLRESAMKDAMLVGSFALLAAQGEGLATSPTTGWDEAKVLEAIGLGDSTEHGVALVIAAGYPAEQPEHPGRLANRLIIDRY